MDESRVLISGTSRGLGREMAIWLLQQGSLVVGCSRSESTIEHANYHHVRADVGNENDVNQLMKRVRETVGGLDALINNAGVARMLPVALTPVATVRNVMDVNFMGTYLLTHGSLRLLRKAPHGRIINFTTVAAPLRLEGEAVYASAKAAIEMFTRIVAKEVGPMGITCNAVGPSPIKTDLIKNVPTAKLQALIDQQSIQRWATFEDVKNVIEFYLRPESDLITGQVLYLGGLG